MGRRGGKPRRKPHCSLRAPEEGKREVLSSSSSDPGQDMWDWLKLGTRKLFFTEEWGQTLNRTPGEVVSAPRWGKTMGDGAESTAEQDTVALQKPWNRNWWM